jgi:hypothetical protein
MLIASAQAKTLAPLCLYHHTWEEAFSDVWVLGGGIKRRISRTAYLLRMANQAAHTKNKQPVIKDLVCKMDGTGQQSSLLSAPRLQELLKAEREKLKALSRADLEKNDQQRVDAVLVKHLDLEGKQFPADWDDVVRLKIYSSWQKAAAGWALRGAYALLYLDTMYEQARSEQRRKLIDQLYPVRQ